MGAKPIFLTGLQDSDQIHCSPTPSRPRLGPAHAGTLPGRGRRRAAHTTAVYTSGARTSPLAWGGERGGKKELQCGRGKTVREARGTHHGRWDQDAYTGPGSRLTPQQYWHLTISL